MSSLPEGRSGAGDDGGDHARALGIGCSFGRRVRVLPDLLELGGVFERKIRIQVHDRVDWLRRPSRPEAPHRSEELTPERAERFL